MLYAWHPLQIGTAKDGVLAIQAIHPTPWYFKHVRGSACPIRMGQELWALVHSVEYSQPRKYFHSIVVHDGDDYTPLRVSLPFTFKASGIEYCLGWKADSGALTFAFSSWDDNPCLTTVPLSRFQWMSL
jgi:hypothetical protein